MSGGGGFSLTFCTQGVVRMVFSLPRARVSINRVVYRSSGSGWSRSGWSRSGGPDLGSGGQDPVDPVDGV